MSWYSLINVLRENAQDLLSEQNRPPLACPNDGEPLSNALEGNRHCAYDGWMYPRDWIAPGR